MVVSSVTSNCVRARPKGPEIRQFYAAGMPDYRNKLAKLSLVPSRKQRKQKANTKKNNEHY